MLRDEAGDVTGAWLVRLQRRTQKADRFNAVPNLNEKYQNWRKNTKNGTILPK